MSEPQRPAAGTYGLPHPTSIPHYLSDNAQRREVVLVDPRGRELLVREPRLVGFRLLSGEAGNRPPPPPPPDRG